jgi:hypothetical protein
MRAFFRGFQRIAIAHERSRLAFVLLRPDRIATMIRRACAWMLLVLAGSPVTAPFSTCDLTWFLTHSIERSIDGAGPRVAYGSWPAVTPPATDATSISPVVSRAQSHESRVLLACAAAEIVTIPDPAAPWRIRHLAERNPYLQEPPTRDTVLRL